MKRKIHFGTKAISFILSYHNRKSLAIKVHPDSSVQVLAPDGADENDVLVKVKSKAPWILKQIAYFDTFRPASPPRKYINGETHLYLGRQYKLKKIQNTTNVIKVYRGQMLIHTGDTSAKALEKQLQRWYRDRARNIFDELLTDILPKFRRYKIERPSVTVRTMSKRWGSCTREGKIILNVELVKAPKGCIEYVIIHELCHLVYHSHTKAFYDLQTRMLPDWKKWKDRLEYLLA